MDGPNIDTSSLAGLPLCAHILVVGLHPDDCKDQNLSSSFHSATWNPGKGETSKILPERYPPKILYSYPPNKKVFSPCAMKDKEEEEERRGRGRGGGGYTYFILIYFECFLFLNILVD